MGVGDGVYHVREDRERRGGSRMGDGRSGVSGVEDGMGWATVMGNHHTGQWSSLPSSQTKVLRSPYSSQRWIVQKYYILIKNLDHAMP